MEDSKANQGQAFPAAGEFFGMCCIGWKDNSYKNTIFECLASDEYRVVAKAVAGSGIYSKDPLIFFREDWAFQDVSALLGVFNLGKEVDPEDDNEPDLKVVKIGARPPIGWFKDAPGLIRYDELRKIEIGLDDRVGEGDL